MNLSQLLSVEWAPYLLPGLILVATGLMVMLLLLNRKREVPEEHPPTPMPPRPKRPKRQEGSSVVTSTASDRRTSLRRDGPAVEVVVQSSAFKSGSAAGYVLDRSTGGLRLALSTGMAAGAALQVRAKNAPDTTPWVTVLVRSCLPSEDHFELGCEFEKTPPWNVLLLFG